MHPDALIAGLRSELERLRPSDPDHDDRHQAILEEIEHVDKLPRPPIALETTSVAVADTDRTYLSGLRQELARAEKDRKPEIKAEIARAEKALKAKLEGAGEPESAEPAAEAAPVPDPAQLVAENTKADLQAAAADQGIEVPSSATKADIAEAIVADQVPPEGAKP